ncbi:MAG: hypothetical protein MJZ11_06170 [Lachnospiraceae bacterium]|nr:hypothetical protein [Lachnospiraceae bacterium]
MDEKLKQLFDFQKFENNAKLSKIIKETEDRYDVEELDEDDLLNISAAGTDAKLFRSSKRTLPKK